MAATLILGAVPRQSWAGLPSLSGLTLVVPPVAAPDIEFFDADGASVRLSAFRGRGVVLNFWATWCVPCVAELPALAALSRALAPDDIGVLPLSSDKGGAAKVRQFLADQEIAGLPVLLDPMMRAGRAFETRGVPTTVLIGRDGTQRARMEGAADWSSSQSVATVRRLLA